MQSKFVRRLTCLLCEVFYEFECISSTCNYVQTRQLLYYIGIKTSNAQRLLRPFFTKPNQSI